MAERTKTSYKRLFELQLLHHYWLDDGQTVFDQLDEDERLKRLLRYDVRNFLTISATPSTEKRLKQIDGVFKATTLGGIVVVPDRVEIPSTAHFDFIITIQDANFFQYTALTLPNQAIQAYYHKIENTTYRYKENVAVLSNQTGVSRTINGIKQLFLSKEFPTTDGSATTEIESLVMAGHALSQLASLLPDSLQELTDDALTYPVFMHQNDVPLIAPPPAMAEFPQEGFRGIQLSADISDNVYTLVRVYAERPNDPDFSCVINNKAKESPPVFQIRIKNRSTHWVTVDKRTGNPISTALSPQPFTRFYTENNPTPTASPDTLYATLDPNDSKKATRLFAQLFQ